MIKVKNNTYKNILLINITYSGNKEKTFIKQLIKLEIIVIFSK